MKLQRPDACQMRAWGLSMLGHLLVPALWLSLSHPFSPEAPREKAVEVELIPAPQQPLATPKSTAAAAPAEEVNQIPQLQPGALAQQSSAPPTEPPHPAPPSSKAQGDAKPKPPPPVTQNERDMVLAQVLRFWVPPKDLSENPNSQVSLAVMVRADGYFADQYDARRQWNPAETYEGYHALPTQSLERRTIDALYRAIRQAQPIPLPPAVKGKAPFAVKLKFRFKDVGR